MTNNLHHPGSVWQRNHVEGVGPAAEYSPPELGPTQADQQLDKAKPPNSLPSMLWDRLYMLFEKQATYLARR
jgi:hypothetical protein